MCNYLKTITKSITVAMVIVVVVALGMASDSGVAQAQEGPSGQFASGIACINLSDNPTNASIAFYDLTGSLVTTVTKPEPLAPNAPWLLFTTSIGELEAPFEGSAIVNAGEPTACSVNTQTTTGTQRVGTGEGVSAEEAGPKLFATQVVNGLGAPPFSSFVAVQNTTATPTDVEATFYDRDGTGIFSDTVTIQGNASHTFYQDDGNFPDGYLGSAIFESTNGTPLAGVVAMYNDTTGQYLSFNTFTEGSADLILPRLAKNLSGLGYTSGFSCVNLGPNPANITMNVSMIDQDTPPGTQPVNAQLTRDNLAVNTAWLVYLGDPTGTDLDTINRGFGSARVQSTGGNVACTANEDVRTSPNTALIGQGSTYSGVPIGEASEEISFPQIVALGADSFRGGFQIANTSSNPTTCDYEFSNGDTINDVPLAGNGANSVFGEDILVSDTTGFNGSAVVTCGEPVVGIYNLSIIGDAASGDPFSTNNGINRQPNGTTEVN